MQIKYTDKALKQLSKISNSNKKDAQSIADGIKEYAENKPANANIRKLKGKLKTYFRMRIGNYRAIFNTKNETLFVYNIKHRKDIYND